MIDFRPPIKLRVTVIQANKRLNYSHQNAKTNTLLLKPKINIFHHYTGIGGASKSLLVLCDCLKEFYDLHIYLGTGGPPWIEEPLRKRNIRFSYLNGLIPLRIVNGTYWPALLRICQELYIRRKLNSEMAKIRQSDLALYNSFTLLIASRKLRDKSKKVILFQRETFSSRTGGKCPKRYMAYVNALDAIVHISQYDKVQLKPNAKQYVIPNIPNPTNFSAISAPNKVYFAGGYNPIKGLKEILTTISENRLKFPLMVNIPRLETEQTKTSGKDLLRILLKKNYKAACARLLAKADHSLIEFQGPGDIPWGKFTYLLIWPTVPHQLRLIRECYQHGKIIICPNLPNYREFLHPDRTLLFDSPHSLAKILSNLNFLDPKRRLLKPLKYPLKEYQSSITKIIDETLVDLH